MQPGLTLLLPASDTKAALKIKLCIMLFHPLLVPLAAWGTTLKILMPSDSRHPEGCLVLASGRDEFQL
ncbi:MAG: hypothetical protein ACOY31_02220, partial [Bacillota bacterium]